MGDIKVKAKHQIVHDGQTLTPGTIFLASKELVDELLKSDAVELVDGDQDKDPVELKSQTPPLSKDSKVGESPKPFISQGR